MAISVEGQLENGKGWIQIVAGAVLAILLLAGTYYLFFQNPPLVDVIVPEELETISRVSEININPENVTQSELYLSLVEHVAEPVIENFGRENPFERF